MLSTTFSTFVENYMRVTQTHVRIPASPLRRLRSRNRTPVCSPLPDRGAALPAEIRVCAMVRRALRSLTLLLTRHIYADCLIKCRVEQCCLPLPHQYEIARANTAPQPSCFIAITRLALQRCRGIARMLCQSEGRLPKPTSRTDIREHRTVYHTEDSVQCAADPHLNGSICGSIRKTHRTQAL